MIKEIRNNHSERIEELFRAIQHSDGNYKDDVQKLREYVDLKLQNIYIKFPEITAKFGKVD